MACGPAPPQAVVAEPRVATHVPAPVAASPFVLPSLADDGFPVPHVAIDAPLLPTIRRSIVTDLELEPEGMPWSPADPDDDAGAAPGGLLAVDDLLDGLDVTWDLDAGVVTFEGADADLAGRLLAAATIAAGRSSRVEVAVVRIVPGARTPTADEVLAMRGADVVLRADRILRDGAALVVDDRETVSFPGAVEIDSNAVYAVGVLVEAGARLAVAPARLGDDRDVLRVAFHETRVDGERTFVGDHVERVAPSASVASLVFDAPARSGVADVAIADSGDPATSFAIAWRVTPRADPPIPPGVRAVSLHASRRPFRVSAVPACGVSLPLETVDDEDVDLSTPEIPASLAEAAGDGLAVVVPPGLLVVSGDDAALAQFDASAARDRAADFRAARFRDGATSIPFVGEAPVRLVQGRIVPAVLAADSEIAQASAFVAHETSWVLTGRTLDVAPNGRAAVWRATAAAPAVIDASRASTARTFGTDTHASEDSIDRLRGAVERRSGDAREGEPPSGGVALEAVVW